MLKLNKFFIALALFSTPFISAQTASGVLMDKNTKESIPFATVSIGENYGVITNNEGGFAINTSRFTENDSISFSCMGYGELKIPLKELQTDTIYLEQSMNELAEIYLVDRELSAFEIVEKVLENVPENYDNSFNRFTVFERHKTASEITDYAMDIKRASFLDRRTRKEINRSMDSMRQKVLNITTTNYTDQLSQAFIGQKDTFKLSPIKAINLVNTDMQISEKKLQKNSYDLVFKKLKTGNTFKVKSGLFTADDSMNVFKEEKEKEKLVKPSDKRKNFASVLRRNGFTYATNLRFVRDIDKYEYSLKEITSFNGEMVYVISFSPDKNSAKYAGEMYVSAENFAVVKANYQLVEGKTMNKINLKFILGLKTLQDQSSGMVIYEKNREGKYLPKYFRSHTREYMYINRPVTFTENNPDRKERIKFKFKILIETLNSFDSEILFTDNEPLTEEAFASFEEPEGVPLEEISQYDPSIWEGYNIIAPDKAIREYQF